MGESEEFFEPGTVVKTIEMHCGGSPMRIVASGVPKPKGNTYDERFNYLKTKQDFVRRFVTNEPRGNRDLVVALLMEPDKEADLGVVFLSVGSYLAMCGESTLCTCRYAVDNGLVKYQEPEVKFTLQCPCGLVECYVQCADGKAGKARFHSVPSFVHTPGVSLMLPNGQSVKSNVVFGGAFYLLVDDSELGFDVKKFDYKNNMSLLANLEREANKQIKVSHPDKDIKIIAGSIIKDSRTETSYHIITLMEDCIVRGFCGAGSTSRATLDYFSGRLKLGESRLYAGVIAGGATRATPLKTCKIGTYDAVVISIEAKAYYTGRNELTFESDDDLKGGFET